MDSATLQEILSQPETWEKTLARAAQERWELPPAGQTRRPLLFVGCGTSFYLAQSAAASFTRISGDPGRAVPSSEVFLFAPNSIAASEKPLVVAISRSGTTTETVWAAKFLREQLHVPVIALSCYADRALAHEGDWRMIIPEAQEKSVVMTRSFTSQLLGIFLAAAASAKAHGLIEQLGSIPERGSKLLDRGASTVQSIADDSGLDHFIFLGQGVFYGGANEAMLKMKEMSLSFSEAYHSMEYRHGPMSIAGAKSLITIFISDAGREHEIRLLEDMKKLGARTFVLCGKADDKIRAQADHLIEIGDGLPEEARLLLAMPMIQLLAYYRAVAKKLNPDTPRHLSQVVTL